jgi:cytochrome b
MKRLHIWDLPTRLTHWLLAASIAAAIVTGQIGGNLIDWHGRLGLLIVGLIVFRLVWGFVGSHTARFASFVRGPAAIKAYLRGEWRGIGHNPLGALSVVALLTLVAAQVATGLFTNDDISFQGPLADLISKELSDKLTGAHKAFINILIGLVVLHIAAIVYYLRVKKENLVKPMLTGWKEGKAEELNAPSSTARGSIAGAIVALALAGLAVWGASGIWQAAPPPPPPAATSTPSW